VSQVRAELTADGERAKTDLRDLQVVDSFVSHGRDYIRRGEIKGKKLRGFESKKPPEKQLCD
jgi:hypothetical protein